MSAAGLSQRLAHVYWMGGAPCSGKSSISEMLTEAHGWQQYRCDDHLPRHIAEADPGTQPALARLNGLTWDEIWLRPVEEMVVDEIHIYEAEFPVILDELLAMPADRPLLAEGAALLPHLVEPLVSSASQALWVVPTPAFLHERYPKRGEWVGEILAQCSRPDEAFSNWMSRDAAFAAWIAAQARRCGFRVVMVDGQRSIAQNAAAVYQHYTNQTIY